MKTHLPFGSALLLASASTGYAQQVCETIDRQS